MGLFVSDRPVGDVTVEETLNFFLTEMLAIVEGLRPTQVGDDASREFASDPRREDSFDPPSKERFRADVSIESEAAL
jgi:hypothetical protein